MKNIVFNGQFLARRMTGQERFAYETILELDKIVGKGKVELIVPPNAKNVPNLNNIDIVKTGKLKGAAWEQIDFGFYTIKHHALSINLCSVMPIVNPGIICIHDLSYKVNPQYFRNVYGKLSQIWHKIFFHLAWRFSPIVYTVSNYSKQQMIDIYKVQPDKIHVIENGWQHFQKVTEDETVFDKHKNLEKNHYYFMLGSLAPNKNIEWIFEVADKHPNEMFAIAGNVVSYGNNYKSKKTKNVELLGFVSDGEVKALMKHCKAFVFPSKFEGFGIPPLEALSVGAKIIVSGSSCLPEIYENAAVYIDPNNTDVDLEALLSTPTSGEKEVLEKYSFKHTAEKIFSDMCDLGYDVS